MMDHDMISTMIVEELKNFLRLRGLKIYPAENRNLLLMIFKTRMKTHKRTNGIAVDI